jgi:DNA-binding MarR family transcriptional regulator
MTTEDAPGDEDPIDLVAHETAVLIRRAESARKLAQTLDRSAYLLLDAIAAHNPLAFGSLAERFQLDISTVSRQVAMLEAGGLVARCADPGDGRVCLLAITGSGASKLRAARAARHALFAELLADWSLEDRRALGAALLRLNQAIARRDRNRRGRREHAHESEDGGRALPGR